MIKIILTIIASAILLTELAIADHSLYCYRETGSRVELVLQDSIISARLADGWHNWADVLETESGLETEIEPQRIGDGFDLLRVRDGTDPVQLVERLRQRTEVEFANISLLDSFGNPIYLTESFVANLEPDISQIELDSMNSVHGVIIAGTLFGDPTWVILKLTRSSDHDVLTMANLYHESPIVRYAKASMALNSDAVFLIAYIFGGGPAPDICY